MGLLADAGKIGMDTSLGLDSKAHEKELALNAAANLLLLGAGKAAVKAVGKITDAVKAAKVDIMAEAANKTSGSQRFKMDLQFFAGKGSQTFIKSKIENIQVKTPDKLLLEGWEDVTNSKMAVNTTSKELYNPQIGLKIRFDKGVEGANGFEGVDHYHILNSNYTNKKVDYYFDINGNPVGKGSKASHIVIKGDK